MIEEYNSLLELLRNGQLLDNIWQFVIFSIQIIITIYMLSIVLISFTNKIYIKFISLLFALLILGISYQYPDQFINIPEILNSLKNSLFKSFFIGFLLSIIMMIAYRLKESIIIAPICLSLSIVFIIPAFGIDWGGFMALIGTAGKLSGLIIGYILTEKFKDEIKW